MKEENIMANKSINLIGQRFGHLIVTGISPYRKQSNNAYLECQCDCGFIKKVLRSSLSSRRSTSCGRTKECEFAFKVRSDKIKTHDKTDTYEYRVWCEIKKRCYNPNRRNYKNWGGRGIEMYEPWIDDFQTFYDYLQTLPETLEQFQARTGEKGSLDRINNDNGYIPNNLRWATLKEQGQNTRHCVLSETLVKFILWENKVNKLGATNIFRIMPSEFNGSLTVIERVIYNKCWTNINIDAEISEYERFGTVNGIKI